MVMEGQLQPTIDTLIAHYTAEKLKAEALAA
jgi:peptide chain release factor 1